MYHQTETASVSRTFNYERYSSERGDSDYREMRRRGVIRKRSSLISSLSINDTNDLPSPADSTDSTFIPSLESLARNALLYGLADGHPVTLSPFAQGNVMSLLYDDDFWHKLLLEASRRRLLCDSFITALCSSGLPPAFIELKGGLGDIGISDRWLLKKPGNAKSIEDVSTSEVDLQHSFASASEMLFASLVHLHLSGRGANREIQPGMPGTLWENASFHVGDGANSSAIDRLIGRDDLSTFLHRIARSSSQLQTLYLGPGLVFSPSANNDNDGPSGHPGLSGSLKAISASCRDLRAIHLHEVALNGCSTNGGYTLFEALGRNCANLKTLSLARCTGVHDQHVQALLLGDSSLPSLERLDLSYTHVGGLALNALCNRRIHAIEHGTTACIKRLNLDGTGIDVSQLKIISNSIGGQLEELSILSCPMLMKFGKDVWNILTDSEFPFKHLTSLSVELFFSIEELLQKPEINEKISPFSVYGQTKHVNTIDHDSAQEEDPSNLFLELREGEGWVCRRCTLINEENSARCAACYKKRRSINVRKLLFDKEMCSPSGNKEHEPNPKSKIAENMVYEFVPFTSPLAKLIMLFHIKEKNNNNVIKKRTKSVSYEYQERNVATAAATAFVKQLIRCVPNTITDISIVHQGESEKETIQSKKNATLGMDEISYLANKTASVVRNLELSYVFFDHVDTFALFCQRFVFLQSLKIRFHTDAKGPKPSQLLQIISEGNSTRSIDDSMSYCRKLEVLHLCIVGTESKIASTTRAGIPMTKVNRTNSSFEDENNLLFCSQSIRRLWIQGCSDLQRLELNTPSLESLNMSECTALKFLTFHDSLMGRSNQLEHLHMSGNISLVPDFLSTLKLPMLKRLELKDLIGIHDCDLASLIDSASQSLTCLRLPKCRSLGDITEWFPRSSFRSLSVLQLSCPSSAFDVSSFQSIFLDIRKMSTANSEENNSLRDLSIEAAVGLRGVLAGKRSGILTIENASTKSPLTKRSFLSRHGSEALRDKNGCYASAEMLGVRGIERILKNFVESAREGSGDEYTFPPTLTSNQRKLVHEVAKQMNLRHESVCLKTGVKMVQVRLGEESSYETRNSNSFIADSSKSIEIVPGSSVPITLPLNLHRLLNLELIECNGLAGISLEGPCLVRICVRGCSQLQSLNLLTPSLTILDASECSDLINLPLNKRSFTQLRVAILTGCRNLNESFVTKLVNHCRVLQRLHIFGIGSSEKTNNTKGRQRLKTKTWLTKLAAGRPKLEIIMTKKEWRLLSSKREVMSSGHDREENLSIGLNGIEVNLEH